MHHDKPRMASRSSQFMFMRSFDDLIEPCRADTPEESKHSLRQVLRTARLALEESVSFEDENEQGFSGSSCLRREEIQKADQDWQKARELEAAVREEEAVLLSTRAALASEIEASIQMIEQGEALRAETPLEDVQNAPPTALSRARQDMQAQLQQKGKALKDELATVRMYVRVAEAKTGDRKRKSLLVPPCAAKHACQ